MDATELLKLHPEHTARAAAWNRWRAVYDGTDAIVRGGYFKKHERESEANYRRRCDEALSWGISQGIVDLLVQYLFLHPVERDHGRLAADSLFARFLEDCDLRGNDMETRLREDAKWAGVYGHVGYLVDRPSEQSANQAEDLANDRRPYLVQYFAPAILDWTFERRDGRLVLTFVKLRDCDGTFRLWWEDRWEAWKIDEKTGEALAVGSGENPIREVPFVWLYANPSPDIPGIGLSEMRELARFDLSIMTNVSQGDEVVTYAAFPMMRKPMRRAGDDQEDDTGPTAVLEFDPEMPEGKPDWLEAKVQEPIDAILAWIEQKERRAYKHAHASFIAGVGTTEKSGVALKIEFTELRAALAKKAKSLERCERRIYRLWALWQGAVFDGTVRYPTEFDIDQLADELANLLTAKALVPSRTFAAEVAKRTARKALPDLPDEIMANIDRECDQGGNYNPPQQEPGQ